MTYQDDGSTRLRIGSYEYDTTRALFDGRVGVEGADIDVGSRPVLTMVFQGLVDGDYDVAELGLTFFLRLLDVDDSWVAIPAFPNRLFRHSAVYVNRCSGITGPQDLVDRTLGEFGIYGQDPGVWIKGILMDEHGFRPERNRWVIGPLEPHQSAPFDFVPHPVPDGVDITAAPEGAALSEMLVEGEIDALFSANVPQNFTDGHPDIVRLFGDYEARERDYYRRTGIFPIMHVVAAPRALFDRNPGLARRVYDAFLQAKNVAAEQYVTHQKLYEVTTMLPWTNSLFERNRELLPEDWWPYGVATNRTALDTYLRYFHEQGLTTRRRSVDELFVPELLDN